MTQGELQERLASLREAEGMAWAELHAIQGRIAEVQFWIEREQQLVKLEDLLPPGTTIESIEEIPQNGPIDSGNADNQPG